MGRSQPADLDFEKIRVGREPRDPLPLKITVTGGGEAHGDVVDATPDAIDRGRKIRKRQEKKRKR